jgi:lysophospholipase L1-like esterase
LERILPERSHCAPALIGLSFKLNTKMPGLRTAPDRKFRKAHRIASFSVLALFLSFLASCSPRPQGVVIICAGDSFTDSEYPRHLRRLFSQHGRRAKVLNFGRKGHTSGEYLRFLERERTSMSSEKPDFILLQLGTNDVRVDADFTPAADFAANMRNIVAIFRGFKNRAGGEARILVATIPPLPQRFAPPFGPESAERVRREINPLIRSLAVEEGLVLVDNYALFQNSPELLPDVHPSSAGYRRLAENWYDSLKPLLEKTISDSGVDVGGKK